MPKASLSTTQAPESDERAIPKHVAIIMDGNGRWAKARGMSRTAGHREGVEAARRALQAARDLGLRYLTLYSFSTENWRRPAREVRDLMGLLKQFIIDDLPRLKQEGVRVRILGDKENLASDIRELARRAERETAHNQNYVLQIAFNYGGRDEIVRAIRKATQAVQDRELSLDEITEDTFSQFLDTGDAPDPDLVIRTSGEMRTSNFLIWQAAYAEYVILDAYWPDFNEAMFEDAIAQYTNRDRRYGGVASATG
ncbi:MAG: isoprenyl transferase [Pseudomonadota bacterium]